jgi:hypothetical protein
LLLATGAQADDEGPLSFRNEKRESKEFVERIGVAVIKAARMAPRRLEMKEFKFSDPKTNRKELLIKMSYSGAVTRLGFQAEMTLLLDTSDKNRWEVLNIRYKDTNRNPVPFSEKKVQELIKQLNR